MSFRLQKELVRSLSANLTTLSSIEGQYLGPRLDLPSKEVIVYIGGLHYAQRHRIPIKSDLRLIMLP